MTGEEREKKEMTKDPNTAGSDSLSGGAAMTGPEAGEAVNGGEEEQEGSRRCWRRLLLPWQHTKSESRSN